MRVVSAESSESQNQGQSNQSSGDPRAGSKIKNFASLESLLNFIADGAQFMGIVVGAKACLLVPTGLVVVWMKGKRLIGAAMIIVGPALVILGVVVPRSIDMIVASARDAGIFN
jgi:hypothetical protein